MSGLHDGKETEKLVGLLSIHSPSVLRMGDLHVLFCERVFHLEDGALFAGNTVYRDVRLASSLFWSSTHSTS